MKELNQSVYYTTAQVTELVELSDQNVRKYVRLLEDRKYEVAKDEHNRRLFSANDVLVLRELIKKAKKPGYTLESAADEIMEEIDEIISGASHKLMPANDNNEIREMFSHVISRLDEIQEENRDLKNNIRNLVERLERYDEDNAQRYIGYINALEEGEMSQADKVMTNTETEASEDAGKMDDDHGDNVEKDASDDVIEEQENVVSKKTDQEPHTTTENDENNEENAPSVSETTDRENVDMSEYSDTGESTEDADTTKDNVEKEDAADAARDKGGFLDGLLKIFRK